MVIQKYSCYQSRKSEDAFLAFSVGVFSDAYHKGEDMVSRGGGFAPIKLDVPTRNIGCDSPKVRLFVADGNAG